MVFGIFDFIIALVLIGLNFTPFFKKKYDTTLGCGAALLVFGIILPAISIVIEEEHETKDWKQGEIHDNFELLYLFLKFPIYWGMGIVQLLIFCFRNGKLDG